MQRILMVILGLFLLVGCGPTGVIGTPSLQVTGYHRSVGADGWATVTGTVQNVGTGSAEDVGVIATFFVKATGKEIGDVGATVDSRVLFPGQTSSFRLVQDHPSTRSWDEIGVRFRTYCTNCTG